MPGPHFTAAVHNGGPGSGRVHATARSALAHADSAHHEGAQEGAQKAAEFRGLLIRAARTILL